MKHYKKFLNTVQYCLDDRPYAERPWEECPIIGTPRVEGSIFNEILYGASYE